MVDFLHTENAAIHEFLAMQCSDDFTLSASYSEFRDTTEPRILAYCCELIILAAREKEDIAYSLARDAELRVREVGAQRTALARVKKRGHEENGISVDLLLKHYHEEWSKAETKTNSFMKRNGRLRAQVARIESGGAARLISGVDEYQVVESKYLDLVNRELREQVSKLQAELRGVKAKAFGAHQEFFAKRAAARTLCSTSSMAEREGAVNRDILLRYSEALKRKEEQLENEQRGNEALMSVSGDVPVGAVPAMQLIEQQREIARLVSVKSKLLRKFEFG